MSSDHRSTVWMVRFGRNGTSADPDPTMRQPDSSPTSIGYFDATWSPDGTKILFIRNQPRVGWDLYAVNVDGTALWPAVTNPLNDESPDWGTHLLLL
jgi:Tol biopolymer transport system component